MRVEKMSTGELRDEVRRQRDLNHIYRQQIRQMQQSIERLKGQNMLLQNDLAPDDQRASSHYFNMLRWRHRALWAEASLQEYLADQVTESQIQFPHQEGDLVEGDFVELIPDDELSDDTLLLPPPNPYRIGS